MGGLSFSKKGFAADEAVDFYFGALLGQMLLHLLFSKLFLNSFAVLVAFLRASVDFVSRTFHF